MVGELGSILTGLALATALYAAGAVAWSIHREDDRWWASGRNAIISSAALLGLALTALLIAFLDDQFGIRYVAQHSSRDLPLYLKVSAIWGGQNGSLLLWAFLQTLFAALLAGLDVGSGERSEEYGILIPWATVFLSLIAAFFVGLTFFLSNPFAASEIVPADGQGLNPLLRHPGMVFHPPPMFIGYVGLAVPFALALAALITERMDLWPRVARRWTLVAWLFLGLGLLLGMRWAYDVLGWGGYWGWDPVENAGLMPWITATGMLHSIVMQDERRGFHWWNVVLATLSFVLVLFGTFTTRSGLIESVHAFARSRLGPYFLGAIGLTIIGSIALFYSRRSVLSTAESPEGLLSREGTFTLTMILLLTVTGSVFVGTLLPTLTEALTGQRLEAGPTWFDRVTGPQFAGLVLLMGICPLLGRAASAGRKLRGRGLALVNGAVIGAAGAAAGAALAGFTRPLSLVAFACVGLAGAMAVAEIGHGVVAARRRGGGVEEVLSWVFARNGRRTGGYLVHLGVVLLAVGVIGTRFYGFETEAVLREGESINVQGYTLSFEGLERELFSDGLTTRAMVSVERAGRHRGYLGPRIDEYSASGQTLGTPAVRSAIREDLYVVFAGWSDGGQQVTLKIFINSLVSFLWLGGLVLMTGGALALWPLAEPATRRGRAEQPRRFGSAAWANRLGGVIVALVVVTVAVWALWRPTRTPISPSRETPAEAGTSALAAKMGARPRVGDPAPDVALNLLDGSTLKVSDLRGQVVVVNFWSPECPSCADEIVDFQTVWEEYSDEGVVFLGISFPDVEADVREMVSELGVSYVNGLDAVAAARYGVTGLPETFIIGPQGEVAYVQIGRLTAERLREALDSLLFE